MLPCSSGLTRLLLVLARSSDSIALLYNVVVWITNTLLLLVHLVTYLWEVFIRYESYCNLFYCLYALFSKIIIEQWWTYYRLNLRFWCLGETMSYVAWCNKPKTIEQQNEEFINLSECKIWGRLWSYVYSLLPLALNSVVNLSTWLCLQLIRSMPYE